MSKKVEFTIDDIFGDSLNLKLDEDEVSQVSEDPKKKSKKLVKVLKDGITILDDELMEKVKNKNLSASMVSGFFQCPADWLMDSFILKKLDHEEPIHFLRGHLFHETMEDFFLIDKENRSPKALTVTATNKIKSDKYKHVLEDPETMKWMKKALKGYIKTGFEYKNIDLAQIVKKEGREPEAGIELFVKGKLGNTTRQVVGFIDRLDQKEDGTLSIVDYKTGKKIHPFNPNKPITTSNDFGYWRQQLAYTMLLEKMGHDVSEAKLEFPIAGGTVEIDVNNKELRKQAIKDFEDVDKALNKCIEENFFPFRGHFFCKWCGMLSPDYKVSRFGKLNVSWEDVNQYVEHLEED